jgi:hypothetical protein
MREENKIIQSLWIGPRLSTMEQLCIRSFLANGHEFHLYCYHPITGVPENTIIKDASEIVPESDVEKFPHLANFADWFRYNLIFKKGGWWVDLDTICLKPFDFVEEYVHRCNPFKCPPHAAVMEWCIAECKKKDWSKLKWTEIGPLLVEEATKYFPQIEFGTGQVFHPLDWPDWKRVIDPIRVPIHHDSYAIHLCHEMWRLNKQDPDAKYPNSCLYEELKRKYLKRGENILIAIVTCPKFAARRKTLEDTWVPLAREAGFDVQFFDGTRLGVSDDYASLPKKSKAILEWAASREYRGMLKVDDDCYIQIQKLVIPNADYAGIRIYPNDCGHRELKIPNYPPGTWKYPYASGGCYWVSQKAIKILSAAPLNSDWAEDRWVGDTLAKAGIKFVEVPLTDWDWVATSQYSHHCQGAVVQTQIPNVQEIYSLHQRIQL